MTDMILLSPMTEKEARECITLIRRHLTEARQAALDLRERQGWKALGYANLRECFEAELGSSWQHGYRLADAAEVDQNLSEFSPLGEKITIPETYARQLSKLPAGKQYVAFDRAKSLAAAEGRDLTAKHVEKAVAGVQAEMSIQDSPVIARAVAAGEITPADGVQIKRELESLPPQHQVNVLSLMTEHGLRDSKLVVPLAEMSMRPADRPSKTFEEIQRTGHVAGVPLAQATITDLQKLKDESRDQHISENEQRRRQQQIDMGLPVSDPVVITVWTNAPTKSYGALVRALGTDDLKAIAELLMQHVINEMEKVQA